MILYQTQHKEMNFDDLFLNKKFYMHNQIICTLKILYRLYSSLIAYAAVGPLPGVAVCVQNYMLFIPLNCATWKYTVETWIQLKHTRTGLCYCNNMNMKIGTLYIPPKCNKVTTYNEFNKLLNDC